jgi:hypothetical protein
MRDGDRGHEEEWPSESDGDSNDQSHDLDEIEARSAKMRLIPFHAFCLDGSW